MRGKGLHTNTPSLRPEGKGWLLVEFGGQTKFLSQAEDGIRDYEVTGVQTCALPIYTNWLAGLSANNVVTFSVSDESPASQLVLSVISLNPTLLPDANLQLGTAGANQTLTITPEIGRASCRERV